MGLGASKANDHERAIDMYVKASAEEPSSGIPHFMMASEFATMGEIEKAEAAFANSILLAPGFSIARYQLGLLQFSSGRAALALVTWQPLLNPSSTEPQARALAYFVQGYAALAQDDFVSALSHFQTGLTYDTGNQALSNDVLKVVERVQALGAGAKAGKTIDEMAEANSVSNPEPVPDNSEDSHVLLSAYQNQNRLH